MAIRELTGTEVACDFPECRSTFSLASEMPVETFWQQAAAHGWAQFGADDRKRQFCPDCAKTKPLGDHV